MEVTPPYWRNVRIIPDGDLFQIVTFFCRIPISHKDAWVAGFNGAQDFRGLTMEQALENGEQLEVFMDHKAKRVKGERRINPTQNEDTDFKLES